MIPLRAVVSTVAVVLVAVAAHRPAAAAAAPAGLDPALLAGLTARPIGPASMSGRVAAVAGVPGRPDLLWVGAATGGVWK
jgi:hypothetical protein